MMMGMNINNGNEATTIIIITYPIHSGDMQSIPKLNVKHFEYSDLYIVLFLNFYNDTMSVSYYNTF